MNDSGEFSEADFDACFKEFDKDGSGTIEKDEMATFIKKVAGLWEPIPSLTNHMWTVKLIKLEAAWMICMEACRSIQAFDVLLINTK